MTTKAEDVIVGIKIKPVIDKDGVHYCRYKNQRCNWYFITEMCHYDSYYCELFEDAESKSADGKGDYNLRPESCLEATVIKEYQNAEKRIKAFQDQIIEYQTDIVALRHDLEVAEDEVKTLRKENEKYKRWLKETSDDYNSIYGSF